MPVYMFPLALATISTWDFNVPYSGSLTTLHLGSGAVLASPLVDFGDLWCCSLVNTRLYRLKCFHKA